MNITYTQNGDYLIPNMLNTVESLFCRSFG